MINSKEKDNLMEHLLFIISIINGKNFLIVSFEGS